MLTSIAFISCLELFTQAATCGLSGHTGQPIHPFFALTRACNIGVRTQTLCWTPNPSPLQPAKIVLLLTLHERLLGYLNQGQAEPKETAPQATQNEALEPRLDDVALLTQLYCHLGGIPLGRSLKLAQSAPFLS